MHLNTLRSFLAVHAGLSAPVWLLDHAELTASERQKVRITDFNPLCRGGFVQVSDRSGLGIKLAPDVVKSNLVQG